MANKGIVKTVDFLGRVAIPSEMREVLNIEKGATFEIHQVDDKIILDKLQLSCLFCNSKENLVDFKGKKICSKCIKKINDQN